MAGIDIFKNELVPKHEILSDQDKEELLKRLNITERQLPKILSSDPAAKAIGAKKGDVIRITRKSPTAGKYYYYRLVI
ncbi:MAG: DNA-directed RNA polymerase subunit H [Candidatus Aenigmatarchaeota archaeon]